MRQSKTHKSNRQVRLTYTANQDNNRLAIADKDNVQEDVPAWDEVHVRFHKP